MRRTAALVVFLAIATGCGGQEWPGASAPARTPTPTTSVRPQPTTTTPSGPDRGSISVSDAVAGNKALVDDKRAQLESALDLQADPKLSGLSFDERNNLVRVAFVYTHPERQSRPLYDDFAWQTGRTLAPEFWFPELVDTIKSHNGKADLLP